MKEIIVGTNICTKCNKITYTPNKDDICLINDMPLVKCPKCKSTKDVFIITKITDEFDLLN